MMRPVAKSKLTGVQMFRERRQTARRVTAANKSFQRGLSELFAELKAAADLIAAARYENARAFGDFLNALEASPAKLSLRQRLWKILRGRRA